MAVSIRIGNESIIISFRSAGLITRINFMLKKMNRSASAIAMMAVG
jgi:hypothetical protein